MEERRQGSVLWFMGLSGAGKTTTARRLAEELRKPGRRVELLDGDELRETVCKGLGFTREDRLENVRRIVYVAGLLARNGVDVIVSAITPYREMRDYARGRLPGYIEIFAHCPLAECERRDVKGLYARARAGELPRFTGITDPFEEPEHPDLVIDTAGAAVERNVEAIVAWLDGRTKRHKKAT